MSSFTGSFGDDSTRQSEEGGYDHSFPSQEFESFSDLGSDPVKDSGSDSVPVFSSEHEPASQSHSAGGGSTNGPILPPPSEMEREEGYALREWRRQNAIRLEEKEKMEKEMVRQIIEEAEQYKAEFYKKRNLTIENNKKVNREKEKLFWENQEKFHSEVDKNYWKAIAELIPREVVAIEKRGKKSDEKKKPSINVIQGPKPGKPTDLSRMRQIVTKLKHNPPTHMKPKPPPQSQESKPENAKTDASSSSGDRDPPIAVSTSVSGKE